MNARAEAIARDTFNKNVAPAIRADLAAIDELRQQYAGVANPDSFVMPATVEGKREMAAGMLKEMTMQLLTEQVASDESWTMARAQRITKIGALEKAVETA